MLDSLFPPNRHSLQSTSPAVPQFVMARPVHFRTFGSPEMVMWLKIDTKNQLKLLKVLAFRRDDHRGRLYHIRTTSTGRPYWGSLPRIVEQSSAGLIARYALKASHQHFEPFVQTLTSQPGLWATEIPTADPLNWQVADTKNGSQASLSFQP